MRAYWRTLSAWVVVASVSSLTGRGESPADGWSAEARVVPESVRQSMQDRDYARAVQAIDEASKTKTAPDDYLAYLRGRALYLAKDYDAAITSFSRLEDRVPQSRWVRHARFARALALARKGDFRAAELVYRGEAEYLLSATRRQTLALIYLEFADATFKPPREDQEPDYGKALAIYQQALEVGPAQERRLEVELRIAQCHEQLNNLPEAIRLYAQFSVDHPQSPLDIEARFRLGQCQLALKKRQDARRAWQDLLARYPASSSPRISEAAFRLADTWNLPTPSNADELSLGVAALESFLKRFPQHALAGSAHLRIAQSYLHGGRHEDAAAALERFVKDARWRDREELPEAWNLLGQTYRTQKRFAAALAAWREYLTRFPVHSAWTSVQKEIVATEYLIGLEHYQANRGDEARKCLEEFMSKYPLDERNAAIQLLFAQMQADRQQWEAAIAEWRRLVTKYPGTMEASRAQLQIAQTLEQPLTRFEDALHAYRQVSGPMAAEARRSIDRLVRAALTLSTERVFRADETPQIHLVTRNIESVSVRTYKVDPLAYFRKMHGMRGIEELDVTIVDPDRSFEFTIPGYTKHKQIESTIDVPFPADLHAGVLAVTVSSKTLEATSTVIRTDLDIIVKSSPDEVFVFAENMRTNKPWPGVRLLFSDGRQVVAESATNALGISQLSNASLRQSRDVRVLAWSEGHMASSESPLTRSVGTQDPERGHLYTDMPVYRPGERVHLRGYVRRITNAPRTAEEGKVVSVVALDCRNRPVVQLPVKLTAFGSFHTAFDLPRTGPTGEYRLLVRDEHNQTYQTHFRVQELAQQLAHLTIDAPRRVYYRGEVIEGTLRAVWYHGSPIAGREIRYGWSPAEIHTAKTDAQGEVHFQLPTRDLEEPQTLAFTASLPEHHVKAAANFLLSAVGFRIDVTTARPVFIAGEPFEVTVATRDAEGKPIAQTLRLRVLKQIAADGNLGERLEAEQTLETALDGSARRTLTLAEGGRYVLRAEGTDRFQNLIVGETTVHISGEKDANRLWILADRQTYREGDTAEVIVHWREEPAMALVTFERGRVLDCRFVTLHRGPTKLAVPLTSLLAPHFNLAVAVMHDRRPHSATPTTVEAETVRRFHAANCLFNVERGLKLSLSCQPVGGKAGSLRPGEPAAVTVRSTDLQGRPVEAEVSLAMLPQALAERTPIAAVPTEGSLRGTLPDPAVPAVSSITFACQPTTRPISRRLLSELDREQLAREEEASRDRPASEPFPAGPGTADRQQHTPARPEAPTPIKLRAGVADPFGDPPSPEQLVRREASGGAPAATPPMPPATGISASATAGRDGAAFAPPLPFASPTPEPGDGGSPSTPLPGDVSVETAYWNPSLITGPDGIVTVQLTLPKQPGPWTLIAHGLTVDALMGQATINVVARKPLFGGLKLPAAFTEGDEVDVPVVITNDLLDHGSTEVSLKTSLGSRTWQERKTIDAKGRSIWEETFRVPLRWPEGSVGAVSQRMAVFELSVAGGGAQDLVRRVVPLRPYGMTIFATASGSSETDATAWVQPPEGIAWDDARLQILIGPSIEQGLLDVLTAPRTDGNDTWHRAASEVETAASDLLSAIGLQELLAASRDAAGPQAQELDARARSALATLMLAQNDDGGWSWVGHGSTSDRYTTSRAVWAVSLARKAGYGVFEPPFLSAVGFLRREAGALESTDYESRAILLHALAAAGQGDFAVANQLHRERASLSPAALAYLALALAEMDRKSTAEEVLAALAKHKPDDPAAQRGAEQGPLAWSCTEVELRALHAFAAQAVVPKSPGIREQIEWLLAHRAGSRWAPDKATGPATLALSRWFAQSRFQGERYRLAVLVNDSAVETLDVDPASGTRTIDVPTALLVKAKQKIRFQLTGRGRYTYRCILSGHVPADKLKSTTSDWEVTRTCEPAPREYHGRALPRGFDIVHDRAAVFRNSLGQLPVGGRGLIELVVRRSSTTTTTPEGQLEYLVVMEPIPCGTAVIRDSVRGGFDRCEILPGEVVFYVGRRRVIEPIRYALHGYVPGTYRAAPTVVRDAFQLERFAVAQPNRLAVLPAGSTVSDSYRLSPQELYELGKRQVEDRDFKTAGLHLTELLEKWDLRPEFYKDVVGWLLDVHLELGPPAKIVQYFEIVKEKWPEEEVPFEKIVKVGAAYQDLGEFERSYLVFQATLQGSFARESTVGDFFVSQGEFLRSVAFLNRLTNEYPPEGYVAQAAYATAQRVAANAVEAAHDPVLRAAGVNRVDLLRRAGTMLEGFLTAWPEDPAADQAAFSAASVLLQLKDYRGAAAACTRYAARYPNSQLWDHFRYVTGYCRFASGEYKEAIEICRALAQTQRVDPKTGRPRENPNRHRAIFILGQIYQSMGQFADAVREYGRVADRFSEARLSHAFFLRQAIELPEVTSVKPGAPVELELKFRNLASCDVKVYRIDLKKFGLLKGDLSGITQINLAGIRPLHEETVQLGDGRDYRDRLHRLPLPLIKEGAYLAVARGKDLHASGLILVTPLAVDVQIDPGSDQTRVMARDTATDRHLSGVAVQVIGSQMSDFVSGETDLRGVFVAEGIRGEPTVIAEGSSGQYAFFRSSPSAAVGRSDEQTIARRPDASGPNGQPFDATGPRTTPPRRRATGKPSSAGGLAPLAVDMGGGGPAESESRIRKALASPTRLDFDETPLRDVVAALKRQHGIEIQLDTKVLEDSGILPETPVTRHLQGMTLRSALDLLLRDLDATYAVWNEVLLITTEEQADAMLPTVVYPVHDLVVGPSSSGEIDLADGDFDSLITTISTTIDPSSWDDLGGPGSIQPEPHSLALVVSQTDKAHEKISLLLARLRQAAGRPVDVSSEGLRVTCSAAKIPLNHSTGEAGRIETALDSPTKVAFDETPLADAVQFLKNQHNIEIQLATKTLEDFGVTIDTPITRHLHGVTLRSALQLILHELALTYVVREESLLITTREEADDLLETLVYPARELVEYRDSSGRVSHDFDTLITVITSAIHPSSWGDLGGPGSIEPFEKGASVVVSQTREVHQQIAGLLDSLRRATDTQLGKGEIPLISRLPNADASGDKALADASLFPGGLGGHEVAMGGFGGARGAAGTRRASPKPGGEPAPHKPGADREFSGTLGGPLPTDPEPGLAGITDGNDDLLRGIEAVTRQLLSRHDQILRTQSEPYARKRGVGKEPGSTGGFGGMGGFGGGIGAGRAF